MTNFQYSRDRKKFIDSRREQRQNKKDAELQAIRDGKQQGSALEQTKFLFDHGINPTQKRQTVESVTKGLTDKDLAALRDKIRTTKKNIERGTSKMNPEIVKSWYDFFFEKFGHDFDKRSMASFGKVGQTQYTQSQAGGGQGQQQVTQAPAYINKDDDALLLVREKIDTQQQKCSQSDGQQANIRPDAQQQSSLHISSGIFTCPSNANSALQKNHRNVPQSINQIINIILSFDDSINRTSLQLIMSQLSEFQCFQTATEWKDGKRLKETLSQTEQQKVKKFILAVHEQLKVKPEDSKYRGLVLMLPVILHLFEGLGPRDDFVKSCQSALDEIQGGKESFRDEYIKPIFGNDNEMAEAFVQYYSYLDTNTIELLTTAYQYDYKEAIKVITLLRSLKTDSNEVAQRGLLDWAIQNIGSLEDAVNNFPVHKLADHIQDYSDTEKFMIAFDDNKFGQCKETFTEGPDYWIKIPKTRAQWEQAGLKNDQIVKVIFKNIEQLGFSKDRSSDQISALRKALTVGLLVGKIKPQITSSPYSTGKTVLAMNLACTLAELKQKANIWFVALHDADAIQQHQFLRSKGIDAEIATCNEEFENKFESKMLCTTHNMLSKFANDDRTKALNPHCIVDEVDRLSECQSNTLGFFGAKGIIKNVKFFYGVCADELTDEEKIGLGCPQDTEYHLMCLKDKLNPKITVDKITESGDQLYQRLVHLVTQEGKKLVICVEKANQIKDTIKKLAKAGIKRDRIVKFDPENINKTSQQEWEIINQLMTNPGLKDIVVTWEAGNRSKNYFPQCYPVAMFYFQQEKELNQLMGRSIRDLEILQVEQEFRGAVVDNESTKNRKEVRAKEEEDKIKKRQNETEKQVAKEDSLLGKRGKQGQDQKETNKRQKTGDQQASSDEEQGEDEKMEGQHDDEIYA